MAAHLLLMLERGNYGPYNSFKEYLAGERRTTEVTAFRLIFAHRMDVLFRENGCPPPSSERQVRPLSPLKKDKQRLLAWTRACKMSKNDNPRWHDVQREAALMKFTCLKILRIGLTM
jgi:hypothetical protein